MRTSEEVLENDLFKKVEKQREISKEELLDETFKKAECEKNEPKDGKKAKPKKRPRKKPFNKSGFFIIIIAIFTLACINYLPWMFIKYNVGTYEAEHIFDKDFQIMESNTSEINEKIIQAFDKPLANHTDNSNSYFGIRINDFSDTSHSVTNTLYIIIIVSIIFIIFLIIDRLKDFSNKYIPIIHAGYAAGITVLGIIILLTSLKFSAAYFQLYFNWPFIHDIGIDDFRPVFIVPIIIVLISLVIIKSSLTLLKVNFKEIEKKMAHEKPEQKYSTYRYGVDEHERDNVQ